MRKLTILFIFMLTASLSAVAKSVVFTLADNTLVYYLLGGTSPVMRFVDGKITVNTDTYEFSGIKNFYISSKDAPDAIESTLAASSMTYSDNTLVVKATEATSVRVYSVGGKEVKVDVQKADGIITVNLNSLDKGAYVISTGDASFKVFKK